MVVKPYDPDAIREFSSREISNAAIQYEISYPRDEQPFLDVSLSIHEGKILTKPYWKPTASGSYLHPASNHPSHTISAIPYAQYLRLMRNLSTKSIFHSAAVRLTNELHLAGYGRKMLNQAKRKVLSMARGKPQRNHRLGFFLTQKFDEPINWDQMKKSINNIQERIIAYYTENPSVKKAISKPTFLAFSKDKSIGSRFSKQIKTGKYLLRLFPLN